ncbi:RHS repeat domain-containing protein [Pontibacter korlensis]|uniref:Sugar-binding protein n=1 Tax=Pontibacter korlensis TaxID=400092 RepID=A0A0E3ZCZ8_9BACT|nr:RHS repeat domain-containing protein [Pontibacter korlensis]AKD02128.1 hypothetical protein PKOR_01965 [Pontibacter korlensis]
MRTLILFCLLLLIGQSHAQTVPNVVNVKTPEVSALNRFVETPVSTFTGVPNISIPLYEISIKDVTVPISLNYHAGGIRVDQEATWVGLGWSLSYGGQVTRVVKGEPDEEYYLSETNYGNTVSYYLSLPNINEDPYLNLRKDYIRSAKYGNRDYMPDEFYYSVPGTSGKFMYSQHMNKFITFPKEDVDIAYDKVNGKIDQFALRLPSGALVELGKDGKISLMDMATASETVDNGWQIVRVSNSFNQSIDFAYDRFDYVSSKLSGQKYTYLESNGYSEEVFHSNLKYYDSRIKTITFPSGTVSFITVPREDMPTQALSDIEVRDKNGVLVRKVVFNYSYFQGSAFEGPHMNTNADYRHKRLRLDSVSVTGTGAAPLVYRFDYHNEGPLPSKYSYAQDHWGYFNGINNQTFIPNVAPEMLSGGDRRVQPEKSKAFVLKSIQYPEGGKTEFVYGSNLAGLLHEFPRELLDDYQDNSFKDTLASMYISGHSRDNFYPEPNEVQGNTRYFRKRFTISNGYKYIGLGWSCYTDFGINDEELSYLQNDVEFRLERINPTDNSRELIKNFFITDRSYPYKRTGSNSDPIMLYNGEYEMIIKMTQYDASGTPVNDQRHSTNFTIRWRELKEDFIHVGGLRVDSINYYNYDGALARQKAFSYITPGTSSSSGRVTALPKYHHRHIKVVTPGWDPDFAYWGFTVQSNSILPLETTAGAYSVYEYVDEKDIDFLSPNKPLLRTSYVYSFARPFFSEYYRGQQRGLYEPQEWLRGKLLRKKLFKGEDVVQEETYTYYDNSPHLAISSDEDYVEEINTDMISHQEDQIRIDSSPADFFDGVNNTGYVGWYYGVDNYQVSRANPEGHYIYYPKQLPYYKRYTGFDKPRSRTVTTYDDAGNSVTEREEYFYERTPKLHQLTRQETTDSKGGILESRLKYPVDFTGTAPYDAMQQQGMLSPVVEEASYRDGVLLEANKTVYGSWGEGVFAPALTERIINGTPPQPLLRFHGYDREGNPLDVSKDKGPHVTYLWSYRRVHPVAQIVNASYAEVEAALGGMAAVEALATSTTPSQAQLDQLNGLRSQLPGAMVTTYTYVPLVGMTTQTDPNGRTTHYEYDGIGRLQAVKDDAGNVLKSYEYNYRK